MLLHLPATRHTYRSHVNVSRLPVKVSGVRRIKHGLVAVDVPIKDAQGDLLDAAIPRVTIVKDGSYVSDDFNADPDREFDLIAQINQNLTDAPLSGFIVEGLSPY